MGSGKRDRDGRNTAWEHWPCNKTEVDLNLGTKTYWLCGSSLSSLRANFLIFSTVIIMLPVDKGSGPPLPPTPSHAQRDFEIDALDSDHRPWFMKLLMLLQKWAYALWTPLTQLLTGTRAHTRNSGAFSTFHKNPLLASTL